MCSASRFALLLPLTLLRRARRASPPCRRNRPQPQAPVRTAARESLASVQREAAHRPAVAQCGDAREPALCLPHDHRARVVGRRQQRARRRVGRCGSEGTAAGERTVAMRATVRASLKCALVASAAPPHLKSEGGGMSAPRPPHRTSSGPQRQPPPALRGAAQRGEVRQREEGERVQQHVGGKLEERAELHGAIAFLALRLVVG
mmetsp:Transcript_24939/g.82186  ORF Transcript_24939/g.82186 Transcript_24939/m.82186 type:complete len:204 (-) Transcript_24939:101-712(-)